VYPEAKGERMESEVQEEPEWLVEERRKARAEMISGIVMLGLLGVFMLSYMLLNGHG
jgi:hypothetical protein